MTISSGTPEGLPNRCPVCGNALRIEPSIPPGDAPCPSCGSLLWFAHHILGDASDVLFQDALISDLAARTAPDAIREIVERLVALQAIERAQQSQIVEALLKREELGSTAIGRGFAVPHARHRSVKRLIGALAVSQHGVDFSSLDRRPVHTIFLLISPPIGPGDHIRALQRIAQFVRTQPS